VKLLLDAHTLIWAVDDPSQLGSQAAASLRDANNELLLSAGTIWVLSIKVGLGKLTLSLPYRQWMTKAITDLGAIVLPITVEHADVQAGLPFHHRDPFDRLLVAQSQVESVRVVSSDTIFDDYGTPRLWS
jgi:PIN domain nuclease of toxin-antitoxin system